MTRWITLALIVLVASPLTAQRGRRCSLEVLNVDREGVQQEPFQGYVNYYGGGNVRLACVGQDVRLGGDSLISLNSDIIYLFKNARYSDGTIRLVADSLMYSKQSERIEARGAVTVTNIRTGSTITGPHLDYLRAVAGMRDSSEVFALERPTVRYVPTRAQADTAGAEPYVIVADRLRGLGSSFLWGGGAVTIDRGSMAGTADSMFYRTGTTNDVELIGMAQRAVVRDTAGDSLRVEGQHVLLGLASDELRRVRAHGDGEVRSGGSHIRADSISIMLDSGKVSTTSAWDRAAGAVVRNGGYDIGGDSVWISSPGERLREIRVFGDGIIQSPFDSTTLDTAAVQPVVDSILTDSTTADSTSSSTADDHERDTLWGERIVAEFQDIDSSGTTISRLQQITAIGTAASLFSRQVERSGTTSPSITYTRADTIVIVMRTDDTTGVLEVRARRGVQPVDGVQLERASLRRPAPPVPTGGARREDGP